MALRLFTVLCFTALVQLLGLQITAEQSQEVPIKLSVINNINQQPQQDYNATAKQGGVLLGAMRRLQQNNSGFNFTGSKNPDFGFFVESVNGFTGNFSDRTFWQILSNRNGALTPTPLGVSCYIPKAEERIVFNFTTFGAGS